ncbi:MAG: hypothetical protein IJI65_06330 [Lachnospiraceae bacterium]|nr:hypothetical protein [Lachnospiraceae bacterium]
MYMGITDRPSPKYEEVRYEALKKHSILPAKNNADESRRYFSAASWKKVAAKIRTKYKVMLREGSWNKRSRTKGTAVNSQYAMKDRNLRPSGSP